MNLPSQLNKSRDKILSTHPSMRPLAQRHSDISPDTFDAKLRNLEQQFLNLQSALIDKSTHYISTSVDGSSLPDKFEKGKIETVNQNRLHIPITDMNGSRIISCPSPVHPDHAKIGNNVPFSFQNCLISDIFRCSACHSLNDGQVVKMGKATCEVCGHQDEYGLMRKQVNKRAFDMRCPECHAVSSVAMGAARMVCEICGHISAVGDPHDSMMSIASVSRNSFEISDMSSDESRRFRGCHGWPERITYLCQTNAEIQHKKSSAPEECEHFRAIGAANRIADAEPNSHSCERKSCNAYNKSGKLMSSPLLCMTKSAEIGSVEWFKGIGEVSNLTACEVLRCPEKENLRPFSTDVSTFIADTNRHSRTWQSEPMDDGTIKLTPTKFRRTESLRNAVSVDSSISQGIALEHHHSIHHFPLDCNFRDKTPRPDKEGLVIDRLESTWTSKLSHPSLTFSAGNGPAKRIEQGKARVMTNQDRSYTNLQEFGTSDIKKPSCRTAQTKIGNADEGDNDEGSLALQCSRKSFGEDLQEKVEETLEYLPVTKIVGHAQSSSAKTPTESKASVQAGDRRTAVHLDGDGHTTTGRDRTPLLLGRLQLFGSEDAHVNSDARSHTFSDSDASDGYSPRNKEKIQNSEVADPKESCEEKNECSVDDASVNALPGTAPLKRKNRRITQDLSEIMSLLAGNNLDDRHSTGDSRPVTAWSQQVLPSTSTFSKETSSVVIPVAPNYRPRHTQHRNRRITEEIDDCLTLFRNGKGLDSASITDRKSGLLPLPIDSDGYGEQEQARNGDRPERRAGTNILGHSGSNAEKALKRKEEQTNPTDRVANGIIAMQPIAIPALACAMNIEKCQTEAGNITESASTGFLHISAITGTCDTNTSAAASLEPEAAAITSQTIVGEQPQSSKGTDDIGNLHQFTIAADMLQAGSKRQNLNQAGALGAFSVLRESGARTNGSSTAAAAMGYLSRRPVKYRTLPAFEEVISERIIPTTEEKTEALMGLAHPKLQPAVEVTAGSEEKATPAKLERKAQEIGRPTSAGKLPRLRALRDAGRSKSPSGKANLSPKRRSQGSKGPSLFQPSAVAALLQIAPELSEPAAAVLLGRARGDVRVAAALYKRLRGMEVTAMQSAITFENHNGDNNQIDSSVSDEMAADNHTVLLSHRRELADAFATAAQRPLSKNAMRKYRIKQWRSETDANAATPPQAVYLPPDPPARSFSFSPPPPPRLDGPRGSRLPSPDSTSEARVEAVCTQSDSSIPLEASDALGPYILCSNLGQEAHGSTACPSAIVLDKNLFMFSGVHPDMPDDPYAEESVQRSVDVKSTEQLRGRIKRMLYGSETQFASSKVISQYQISTQKLSTDSFQGREIENHLQSQPTMLRNNVGACHEDDIYTCVDDSKIKGTEHAEQQNSSAKGSSVYDESEIRSRYENHRAHLVHAEMKMKPHYHTLGNRDGRCDATYLASRSPVLQRFSIQMLSRMLESAESLSVPAGARLQLDSLPRGSVCVVVNGSASVSGSEPATALARPRPSWIEAVRENITDGDIFCLPSLLSSETLRGAAGLIPILLRWHAPTSFRAISNFKCLIIQGHPWVEALISIAEEEIEVQMTCLQKIPIFAAIKRSELRELLEASQLRLFADDEPIVVECAGGSVHAWLADGPPRAVHIVQAGRVLVMKALLKESDCLTDEKKRCFPGTARQCLLREQNPTSLVGFAALALNKVQQTTVLAKESALILSLDSEKFRNICASQAHHRIMDKLQCASRQSLSRDNQLLHAVVHVLDSVKELLSEHRYYSGRLRVLVDGFYRPLGGVLSKWLFPATRIQLFSTAPQLMVEEEQLGSVLERLDSAQRVDGHQTVVDLVETFQNVQRLYCAYAHHLVPALALLSKLKDPAVQMMMQRLTSEAAGGLRVLLRVPLQYWIRQARTLSKMLSEWEDAMPSASGQVYDAERPLAGQPQFCTTQFRKELERSASNCHAALLESDEVEQAEDEASQRGIADICSGCVHRRILFSCTATLLPSNLRREQIHRLGFGREGQLIILNDMLVFTFLSTGCQSNVSKAGSIGGSSPDIFSCTVTANSIIGGNDHGHEPEFRISPLQIEQRIGNAEAGFVSEHQVEEARQSSKLYLANVTIVREEGFQDHPHLLRIRSHDDGNLGSTGACESSLLSLESIENLQEILNLHRTYLTMAESIVDYTADFSATTAT